MEKSNKNRLLEMMNKVGGMPLLKENFNIYDEDSIWKMPTNTFNFEVYMKNPETGEEGWEIEFINVFASDLQEAKHKLEELVPDFDVIILFNHSVPMSDDDKDLFYNSGRHFYFD